MIDADGRIKLTDFGLSEAGIEKIKASASKNADKLPDNTQPALLKLPDQHADSEANQIEMQKDIERVLGHERDAIKKKQGNAEEAKNKEASEEIKEKALTTQKDGEEESK